MTTAALDRMDELRKAAEFGIIESMHCDISGVGFPFRIYDEGGHTVDDATYIVSACNNNATLVAIARVAATVEHVMCIDYETETAHCYAVCPRCAIDKLLKELV